YPILAPVIKKYPATAGPLFQTYNDLSLAQRWESLEIIDLSNALRGGFRGRRPGTQTESSVVVPCFLTESLSMSWISSVFQDLPDVKDFYLAICTEDSSVVYYRMSKGIVKPPL
ncbi:hypothetical protein SISSUDRAFT_985994, partial [Sistotremastrum suecicum HHB10207 ss-3]